MAPRSRRRLLSRPAVAALLAATIPLGMLTVAGLSQPAAAADDTVGGDTYKVTFVARQCAKYTDVRANKQRNNLMESLENLGPDTNYTSGQAVSVDKESAPPQSACTPLVGWKFQSGTGITGKTPGTLNLSTVTTPGTIVTTTTSVPELDAAGNTTGRTISGAVTLTLTAQQVQDAQNRRFWWQGGTKAEPLGALPDFGPTQFGFAALRCANDNVNGDNVEYVNFTTAQRHVFCYYYAVQPPPDSGTIVIRKVVSNPDAAPDQTFDFGGNISYNPGGAFSLKHSQSITFIRGETADTGITWRATETVPTDWVLDPVGCVVTGGSGSTTTPVGASGVDITLVAGETVTCTFTNTYDPPRPDPSTLEIDKYAFGGDGTFGWELTGPDPTMPKSGDVSVTNNNFSAVFSGEITTGGTYTLTETMPVRADGSWELTEILCDGATATVTSPTTATIDPGDVGELDAYCILVNTFTSYTGALEVWSTTTGAAGGRSDYAIEPLAVPAIEPPPAPLQQSADNTADGTAAQATGDPTDALTPTKYVVRGFGPAATAAGSWTLESVECGSAGESASLANAQITVTVPPNGTARCDFVWKLQPPATLDVTKAVVLSGGSRTGTVVIDVTCDDGTAATLTVASSDPVPASLTPTLSFVGVTGCDLAETSRGGSNVTTAWESTGPDGTTSGSGTTTSVQVDQPTHPGGAYAVTFTNTYRSGPTPPSPTPTPTPSPTVTPTPTPTPTPSPTVTPTPTPTPSPTNSRDPQRPVKPPVIPPTIEPGRPTVVLPGTIGTNAGQPARATVTCTPLSRSAYGAVGADRPASRPVGDVRLCDVRRTKSGKITVTVLNPPVRVRLVITAPATDEYRAYRKVVTWIVR